MPVISTLGAMSSRGFGEFNQQAQGKYIEDYFSTYLYTGDGSSSRVISTGIALADTASWSTLAATTPSAFNFGYPYNTAVANANGVYLAGSGGGSLSAVAGINPTTGATLFSRTLTGSSGNDFYNAVTTDSAGNIICTGRTSGGFTASVVKYNSSGTIQWQRQFGNTTTIGTCIGCDSSNNIYVAGNYTTSYTRGFMAKYNSSGALQWQVLIYDTASATQTKINSLVVGASGDVYICGESYDSGAYPYAYVAKINTSGVFQWSRSLKVNYDAFDSISIDSSDNIYVCGRFNQISTTYGILAKYNSSGTLQWQIKATTSAVRFYACASDSSGNTYLNIANKAIAKINTSGAIVWQNTVTTPVNNYYGVFTYGTNVYGAATDSLNLTTSVFVIPTDGTATSGSAGAFILSGASYAVNAAAGTSATATVAVTTGSLTEAALTQTDAAATITTTKYTQAAVTGAGGLIWVKGRDNSSNSTGHILTDTARGRGSYLQSQNTNAAVTSPDGYDLTAFLANGFSIGQANNFNFNSSVNYASWTWRKTPKFFDVVTYSGNSVAGRTISHNLGSVPGMIIVKIINDATQNWMVWHRSIANTQFLMLNRTDAVGTYNLWNNTAPTSTNFTVSSDIAVNESGYTYVAYLFAHNAGGFGLDGTQNVISCGSFTTDGSGAYSVNLGWEPQFILVKQTNGTANWYLYDTMRGLPDTYNGGVELYPNTSGSEQLYAAARPRATGFYSTNFAGAGATHIYMAIRRGPMKVPTDATTVFSPTIYTGDYNPTTALTNMLPATDVWWNSARTISSSYYVMDRLRGWTYFNTPSTAAENSGTTWSQPTQTTLLPSTAWWSSSQSQVNYFFKRAPGFMDEVCYTATGSGNLTLSHNLGAVPQMMIVKGRSGASDWPVYHIGENNGVNPEQYYLRLNATSAATNAVANWGNTSPTATQFTVAGNNNASGYTYVAYLFATCPGVSKVGSYTGTGATQTISCGFTGGARYVLIKRTDSTGDWWVWDTARGMVAGTDPRTPTNSATPEANANWVYTATGGFQIVTSDATVNASGGTYIYLAIA